MAPQKEADWSELNNCGILPLADGSLGTLVTRSKSDQSMYFSVNADDRDLFSFAANVLVSSEIGTKFTDDIISSERFNVHKLNNGHIGKLLKLRRDWPAIPNRGHSDWLVRLWEYINRHYSDATAKVPFNITQLQQLPLHEGSCGTKAQYTSLESFPRLPAIIKSAFTDERTLCLALPGLYMIDPKMLPAQVISAELVLSHPASFRRLLEAMALLASRQEKTLEDYIRVNLSRQNLKVYPSYIRVQLRRLIDCLFSDSAADCFWTRKQCLSITPLRTCQPDWIVRIKNIT